MHNAYIVLSPTAAYTRRLKVAEWPRARLAALNLERQLGQKFGHFHKRKYITNYIIIDGSMYAPGQNKLHL